MPAAGRVVLVKALSPWRKPTAGVLAATTPVPHYQLLRTTEVDEYETSPTKAAILAIAALAVPPGNKFLGKSRKKAKLSLSSAKHEKFDDLTDLIETLPSHEDMVDLGLPTTSTSGRVAEEDRNVQLSAFLYAASREDDNDFHLILGRDPDVGGEEVYMTVEISGLPSSAAKSFQKLKGARSAFTEFFGVDLPGMSYDFYNPPIPVLVRGSLFWDASHATGSRPGPQSLRPHMPVVWEIHPISRIVLEP